ncbi:energy transducer TonB [Mucilaginibacter sp. UR6-1]|uniref:energy transducer TonB n=1 Tax=Mucilaginibacter sp. UR6-1 TaxID=1435643 RepID=UPI001E407CAD|nr:energy transducer TonB [Mucilaginibacter sp. UR6-1]MCC8410258.1 energy transducer TonB [Mucilaginibacter sp. UR6-1]
MKETLSAAILLLCISLNVKAQTPKADSAVIDTTEKIVDKKPLKKYTNGSVVFQFVVERDGSLSDIKIIKHLTPELDSIALKKLKASPKWQPATLNGKPIRKKFTFPMKFTGYYN